MRQLEANNTRLKKMQAEQDLEIEVTVKEFDAKWKGVLILQEIIVTSMGFHQPLTR